MQNGEYIKDRLIVEMVEEACAEIGVEVHSFSDDWVLELRKNGSIGHVFGYKFGFNNAAAASIAQDKVAAYQVMASYGVNAVEHYLIRPSDDSLWDRLPYREDIIIKPLTGTGGRGIERCSDTGVARRKIEKSEIDAWAMSPFYDIAREVRLIILDGDILLSYEKRAVVEKGLRFFNLGKGATPVNYEPALSIQKLAVEAINAIGLRVGAVDIAMGKDGEVRVMEINDGIMMENFARHSEINKMMAREVYRTLVKRMFV